MDENRLTEQKKTSRLIFRELPSVVERLQARAFAEGLSLSDEIRLAIRERLREDKGEDRS